jgi:L-rhamnose mutarotase
MKDKIKAIQNAPTDEDIKIELLDALMRVTCQEYKIWANERDDLLLSCMGIEGWCADVENVMPTDIWERFVIDMKDKFKK